MCLEALNGTFDGSDDTMAGARGIEDEAMDECFRFREKLGVDVDIEAREGKKGFGTC